MNENRRALAAIAGVCGVSSFLPAKFANRLIIIKKLW